ncbi:hypothetical protein RhiirB3_442783 [Rhizophagus irregularis]|nr:hypothetical protein RhiirB3_442783 [Rhizophagus irregularis]
MKNHKENKSWFTSLIGYFYQFDKNQLHLIVVKNNDALNMLRNSNTIIGKYFIFFYYKDIILSGIDFKQNQLVYLLELNGNIFELLPRLTEEGNLDAQYNLAICYMDGIGTQKDEKKHLTYRISFSIWKGGVKKYITRAFKGYLKSAENGDAMSQTDENGDAVAQNNIGYCCKYGKRTDKDDKKAFGWYLNSALRINNQTTIHLA